MVSRTAGVLGGMGPAATIDFMRRVMATTPPGPAHIRMLVDHNPGVPDRQAAILAGGPSPGPVLARMARALEDIGAEFIVMPCNTAHAFADDIIAAIDVPFLSIIDACIDALPEGVGAVGVLATAGCIEAGMFQAGLQAAGLDSIEPPAAALEEFNVLIRRIQAGERGAAVAAPMHDMVRALGERGADAIIGGCTEIPLVLDGDALDIAMIASTEVLAARTVDFALGRATLPDQD